MKNTYPLLRLISILILIQTDGIFVISSSDLVTVYRDERADRFALPKGFNCSEVPGVSSKKISRTSNSSRNDHGRRLCSCNATLSPIAHFKVDWKTRNVVIGCFHQNDICPGNS